MQTRTLLSLLFALIAMPARAEPSIIDGSTSAPQVIEVSEINVKGKTIKLDILEYRPEFVTEERTVIEGGAPKTVTVTRIVYVPEQRVKLLTFKGLKAIHPNGKEVAAEKIAAIKKATPVVLSTDPTGNISQRFAKLLAEDAILLLAEREPLPPGVPPLP